MENIKYLFSGSLLNQDANFRIFSNPFLESTSFSPSHLVAKKLFLLSWILTYCLFVVSPVQLSTIVLWDNLSSL